MPHFLRRFEKDPCRKRCFPHYQIHPLASSPKCSRFFSKCGRFLESGGRAHSQPVSRRRTQRGRRGGLDCVGEREGRGSCAYLLYYIRQGTGLGWQHRDTGGKGRESWMKRADAGKEWGLSKENKNLFQTMRGAKGMEADSGMAGRRNFANVKNNRMFNPLKF